MLALVSSCGEGKGPTQPTVPAAVTVTLAAEVRVAGTTAATARVYARDGRELPGQPLTWRSSDEQVARVSSSGAVTGIAPGQVVIEASAGGAKGTASLAVLEVPVSSVAITPLSLVLEAGETQQLSAVALDSAGRALSGRSIHWSSSDTSRVRVTDSGLLSAVAEGNAQVVARAESASASAGVQVVALFTDLAIVDAQLTQGVQVADGSIPMVLGGSAAVLNALLTSNRSTPRATPLVLRLFDENGVQYRADTALVTVPPAAPDYARPSVQYLLPAAALRPGMSWQLERDPRRLVPDADPTNDVFPRAGRTSVATAAVPPLRVRFVPIVLTAHANVTGQVSQAMLPSYTRTLRSVHPIGELELSIGAPFASAAVFGTAPSGGSAAFWQQVLAELDAARFLDPAAGDQHWIGVVAPPPGFNFTAFGGFGFIPANGASTGPGTRTSVLVNVGWFTRPTQSRDLVAHELAHNFGRRHAPCGGAGGPDPSFPDPSGTIGVVGHDVYAWSTALSSSAPAVDASTGDVMGYCFPVWASEYTYRGVLAFRGTGLVAGTRSMVAPGTVQRVLLVRGQVAGDRIRLDPAITIETARTIDVEPGDHVVEGLAADGRVLFAHSFTPARLDHSDVRPFTIPVPIGADAEAQLDALRVRGPNGEALLRSALTARAAEARATRAPGRAQVRCVSGAAVAVQDAQTLRLIGIASDSTITVLSPGERPLLLSCSDGLASRSIRLR